MPKGKGLAPGKPIQRKTRLRSGAPPRATGRPSQRFKKRRNNAYRAWIRSHPCLLLFHRPECYSECHQAAECAHVRTRGAGAADVGECVPLCPLAHRLAGWSVHQDGIKSFQKRFGIDLADVAGELAQRWSKSLESMEFAAVSSDTKERT